MDFFLSVVGSFASLLCLNFFSSSSVYADRTFFIVWMAGSVCCTILAMLAFRSYRIIIRHMAARDLFNIILTLVLKVAMMAVVLVAFAFFNSTVCLALAFDALVSLFLLLTVRLAMLLVYDVYKEKLRDVSRTKPVLVVGTSDRSVSLATRLEKSRDYRIVGFLGLEDDDKSHVLAGYKIYICKSEDELKELVSENDIQCMIFPSEEEAREDSNNLVSFCAKNSLRALIMPTLSEHTGNHHGVREVKIEDLLGRPEIGAPYGELVSVFAGKTVLVTGAAGSIGSEICRQLATLGVARIVAFDNSETPVHNLRLEMENTYPNVPFVPIIGSVRHYTRLDFAFRKWHPQIVFHAAAYKHVPLMEENPCEAVMTNVIGTRNVAQKCLEYDTALMVMISTDKAVNPTNVMGCSKRLAEIYVQSLGIALEKGKVKGHTKFVTTRFGNVLGSNGSVIPYFRKQIAEGGPVTVTHKDIIRYFMTIPEACRLVMEAVLIGKDHQNRIFVFDMGKPVKIDTLARRMIELSGLEVDKDIKIVYTGLRPGEKLYEELLANDENTEPTSFDRIRIAKVREYDYKEIHNIAAKMEVLADEVQIENLVKLMKETVPEFKSANSPYQQYDKN